MRLKNKLYSSLTMLLIIAILTTLVPAGIFAAGSGSTADDLKAGVVNYYKQNRQSLDSWWELGALKGAGADVKAGTWTLPEWESTDLNDKAQSWDYAGYILGYLAKGEDPQKAWDGRNLAVELAGKQKADGSFGVISGHVWAMIALDAAGGTYNSDGAVKWLISQQLPDGGFAFYGDASDPDMTGMALIALSNHMGREDAGQAAAKAVELLLKSQTETGGFSSWGSENSNSIATVISGLVAAGENILSDKWTKNGKTPLDALMRFQLEDKSFSFLTEPKASDAMATCQSLIALGDIASGDSIWKRLKAEQPLPRDKRVDVRVEGIERNIADTYTAFQDGKQLTALDILKQALDSCKISYEIQTGRFGAYIKSINGEQAGKFGGYDGWLYLVNGEFPPVGVGEYIVKAGDELVFYYGMFAPDTLVPNIQIQPAQPVAGEDLTVLVTSSYYDWSLKKNVDVKIKDAVVSFNNNTYTTDAEGRAVVKGATKPGAYALKVGKNTANSYPALVRTGGITVTYGEYTGYSDVKTISDWALTYVQKAGKYGLMNGTDAARNTFEPQKNITRAEFTVLVVRLLGVQPQAPAQQVFGDVSADSWYSGYIAAAKERGLVDGMSAGVFAPDRMITRQEMAVLITRALKLEKPEQASTVEDFDSVADWAKQAVMAVNSRGIMVGYNNRFCPEDFATREMAAAVSVRLYETELKK